MKFIRPLRQNAPAPRPAKDRTRGFLEMPVLLCEWRAYCYAFRIRHYRQPRTATLHSKEG